LVDRPGRVGRERCHCDNPNKDDDPLKYIQSLRHVARISILPLLLSKQQRQNDVIDRLQ
jgi:hypothetical protein